MNTIRLVFAASFLPVLIACGGIGQFSGEVDGQTIEAAADGFYFTTAASYTDAGEVETVEVFHALVTDVPDACEVFTARLKAKTDAFDDFSDTVRIYGGASVEAEEAARDYDRALSDIDEELLPQEHWVFELAMSDDELEDLEDVEREFDDAEVFASLSVFDSNDCEYGLHEDAERFAATDGAIVLERLGAGSATLSGDVQLSEAQDLNDDEGELRLDLWLPQCDAYQDAFLDHLDEIASAF